jgi:hypothetical protein
VPQITGISFCVIVGYCKYEVYSYSKYLMVDSCGERRLLIGMEPSCVWYEAFRCGFNPNIDENRQDASTKQYYTAVNCLWLAQNEKIPLFSMREFIVIELGYSRRTKLPKRISMQNATAAASPFSNKFSNNLEIQQIQ